MGQYLQTLKKIVEEPGFCRLFYGTCKNCGAKIWSVGEDVDTDNGVIKARFLCDCGAKYRQKVYDRATKGGYLYPQGLVAWYTAPSGKRYRVINTPEGMYRITDDGVKFKKKH